MEQNYFKKMNEKHEFWLEENSAKREEDALKIKKNFLRWICWVSRFTHTFVLICGRVGKEWMTNLFRSDERYCKAIQSAFKDVLLLNNITFFSFSHL